VKRLLAGFGVAAVAGSVLPLAAKVWWVFELFTHFRVQLLAGLALLALLFAAQRAWTWCGVLALCMAVNVPPLVPYLRPAPAGATQPATLTVLGVNVEADNDKHAELLASIAQSNPDVVLVVEFTERWGEHLAALAEVYPHQFRRPRFDPFGIALFSRHPFESVEELKLGPTSAIDARLRTPRGTTRVIGVHLLPPISADWAMQRNSQLDALADHAAAAAATEPLIVLGDFNISPYSPYFQDWLGQAHLTDAGRGLGPRFTWPSFLPLLGIPIDHCIVSNGLRVAEYRRLAAFGSDHYPVLARLIQE
jgi:endonuclease/exonuclease/phosphatase (EEP) superfamily protein YafD